MNEDFEPRIVGFFCNWCSYAGADAAGTSRLKYPPNVRVIRVMCSGRVSPELIIRAFRQGADGVLVMGCHPGDCHYIEGNYRTARRIPILQRLLSYVGIEPERLRLEWASAAEGDKVARTIAEFTETIRKLGPLRPKWSL
ncbi:MAG: methyl-viologen-reducing hydrogenase subunit delta [Chloroflexi bacterium]|nr:MAG: methyl-viologen-reducing hydrogenase subunit delta [Chloroflexota bacterium]